MSDTPRVDKETSPEIYGCTVTADFARTLERELNDAKRIAEGCHNQQCGTCVVCAECERDQLKCELSDAKESHTNTLITLGEVSVERDQLRIQRDNLLRAIGQEVAGLRAQLAAAVDTLHSVAGSLSPMDELGRRLYEEIQQTLALCGRKGMK